MLTPHAIEGYNAATGAKCPHLWSSSAAMAWHVGAYLRRLGYEAPTMVSMSRGYTLNVSIPGFAGRVRWNDNDTITPVACPTFAPTTQAAE